MPSTNLYLLQLPFGYSRLVHPVIGIFSVVEDWKIQLLLQIIINRLSFIMVNKRLNKRIKWVVASVILLINLSVYCIWIPARLQISAKWIRLNEIYDPIEKGIYLVVDISLNSYFIYLVYTTLIAQGLEKYVPLFWFNVCLVFVSLSMDVCFSGTS